MELREIGRVVAQEEGCYIQVDKKYLKVINSTFKYYDTKNCERVYNEIMKLKQVCFNTYF